MRINRRKVREKECIFLLKTFNFQTDGLPEDEDYEI